MTVWTQSLSGKVVDLVGTLPEQIDFADMAVQLSRIRRFLGGARETISVARHSLNVAQALWTFHDADFETVAYGLLHDAHEYVIGDITSPVKELLAHCFGDLEPFKKVVRQVDAAIFEAAGLRTTLTPLQTRLVKLADAKMLATEKRDFLAPEQRAWGDLPPPYAYRFPHTTSEEADAREFFAFVTNIQRQIEAARIIKTTAATLDMSFPEFIEMEAVR